MKVDLKQVEEACKELCFVSIFDGFSFVQISTISTRSGMPMLVFAFEFTNIQNALKLF